MPLEPLPRVALPSSLTSFRSVCGVAELVPSPTPLDIVTRPVPSGPLTMALAPSRTVLLPIHIEPARMFVPPP